MTAQLDTTMILRPAGAGPAGRAAAPRLVIDGELGVPECWDLSGALRRLEATEASCVVLDLRRVPRIDGAAMAVLARYRQRLDADGRRLEVITAPGPTERALGSGDGWRMTHSRERTTASAGVAIRVATPNDTGLVAALFDQLSAETIARRFGHARSGVPWAEVRRMVRGPGSAGAAFIALQPGRPDSRIAVARYDTGDAGHRAEFAVVVADAWQRRGVGSAMLRRAVEHACRTGLDGIWALIDQGNVASVRTFTAIGAVMDRQGGGAWSATLPCDRTGRASRIDG